MRVSLMIEGQNGVTWPQWTALARACEEHGLEGLFRSDHYATIPDDPPLGSLDAWSTVAGLAAATERIRLGVLVSPVTFRHPSVLAKSVVTADHISGGRVELGLGAGWFEPDHVRYGFPFPPTGVRMQMLAEQLEIVHRQWTEDRFSFAGEHYEVRDLSALPRPVQSPHPTLIVGGAAKPRTAALAARWADEYNTVFASPEECRARRNAVEAAWSAAGRDPGTLVFSLMATAVLGEDEGEVRERAARLGASGGEDAGTVLARLAEGGVGGTVEQAAERLRAYADAGVDRIMLQHLQHDDVEMVTTAGRIARAVG